jgi:pimeloyl-ACP methyl ester carboxylesterase
MLRQRLAVAAALLAVVSLTAGAAAEAAPRVKVFEGEIEGAPFKVEVPAQWNGTLLLWSRTPVFRPEPIETASDELTRSWLLDHGLALAASNYRTPAGVAFAEPLDDQLALLEWIDRHLGRPRQVIAWGNSGGGLLSTLLAERHPERIDGAIPLCGPLGGIGTAFNLTLDFALALRTLLTPDSDLELVRITDPDGTAARVSEIVQSALGTPQGRARLALANALANVVPWARALQPRPADVTGQINELALYDTIIYIDSWTTFRQDLERRAGGNPSWNTGVDYDRQLSKSSQLDLVRRAYDDAGMSLDADLQRLAAAPRIEADAGAVRWVAQFTPTGRLQVPVLTLHSTGDGANIPEHERWYAGQARRSDDLLRQAFTERGGHCAFTASELIATIQAMRARLDTGHWPGTSPASLNAAARALGPEFQVAPDWGVTFQPLPAEPAFVAFQPGQLPRPFPAAS